MDPAYHVVRNSNREFELGWGQRMMAAGLTLNQRQRDAANSPPGPVILLGGPGTGKSTVLYFRILRLLGIGERSDRILFVTPHDHAADRMRARLTHPDEFETTWTSINDDLNIGDQFRVVSELAPSVRAATIEQLACQLLRQAGVWGYPSFSIWTDAQALRVTRSLSQAAGGPKRLGYDETVALYAWHAANRRHLSWQRPIPAEKGYWPQLAALYEAEKERCRAKDRYDLVPDAIECQSKLGEKMAGEPGTGSLHILVDHFHDITEPEYLLIKELAGPLCSITVASDPAQRARDGAPDDLLNRFGLDHREAPTFALPVTHRASRELAGAIGSIYGYDRNPAAAGPFSYRCIGMVDRDIRPTIHRIGQRPETEVRHTMNLIARGLDEDDLTPGDIAVVYPRGAPRVEWLATQLASRGIPFQVEDELLRKDGKGRGGPSREPDLPSSRPDSDVEALLSILRIVSNPRDKVAFSAAVSAGIRPGARHPSDEELLNISDISRQRDVDLIVAARLFIQQMAPRRATFRALSPFIDNYELLARELEGMGRLGVGPMVETAKGLLNKARSSWIGTRLRDPRMDELLRLISTRSHSPDTTVSQALKTFLDDLCPALHPYGDPIGGPLATIANGDKLTITTAEHSTDREWDWVIVFVDWSPPDKRRGKRKGKLILTAARHAYLYRAASRAKRRLDIIVSPFMTGGENTAAVALLRGILGDWADTRACL